MGFGPPVGVYVDMPLDDATSTLAPAASVPIWNQTASPRCRRIRMGTAVAQDDERVDETQFRLLEWRALGQAPSEYLAAQILSEEGFKDLDPSHPLGGPDGGRDGHCARNGERWTWAVYFPQGQQTLTTIKSKLSDDIVAARKHGPKGVAFVTNQELKLSERRDLRALGGDDLDVDVFHLERIATILDRPHMGPVRQRYLGLSAGRPPIQVQAEVIGVARRLTGTDDPLEFFVEQTEKAIRADSDKAWARIKAEEERKARAEAEKILAKQEKARQEALKARAEKTPMTLQEIAQSAMTPALQNLTTGIDFSSMVPKVDMRQFDFGLPTETLLQGQYGSLIDASPPSEPLSDEEINAKVADYRAQLEARWNTSQDYVAGVAWPGLKFRLRNAGGFLTNVQVVLTFHGARGVEHEDIESFMWPRVEDPDWVEPFDPRLSIPMVAPIYRPASSAEHPVKLEHDDNRDLVVKITLAELRPQDVWTSDDDDVVLVVRDTTVDSVQVTYSITASEYHDRSEGETFTVPVEEQDMFEAIEVAMDASDKSKQ